ncbi:3'-5' exonuclease [Roseateles sp. PN1]|uniref:3'-5' exonuclease n=1 Tax=Roseateles sp. PN1 TaxID=3137372 RepID=UPI00313A4480
MGEIPAILDIEASGFGRGSYPIEVGFVDSAGAMFCSLIQPEPEWQHWDASAEAVHGISRATLCRHGKPPLWVAQQINSHLRGQVVYCDAWAHDYPWLARLFDVVDLVPQFKLADLRCLLSEAEASHWHAVLNQVRLEQALQRHRASSDARILQLTLQKLRQNLGGASEPTEQAVANGGSNGYSNGHAHGRGAPAS